MLLCEVISVGLTSKMFGAVPVLLQTRLNMAADWMMGDGPKAVEKTS
jgi:hypothetical protein